MKHLIDQEKIKFGQRIKALRQTLGLTLEQLAEITRISRGTINTIETGKKGFIYDNALTLIYFFGLDMNTLTNYDLPLPDEQELRDHIKKYHLKNKSTQHLSLKNNTSLSFILKNRILKSSFMDTPREVKQLLAYCKTEYNLDFNSSTMTNALNRLAHEDKVRIIVAKNKKVFLYQKAL